MRKIVIILGFVILVCISLLVGCDIKENNGKDDSGNTETNKTYTVIYETDGNGTIQGNTNQTVKHGENSETVVAIPDEGYNFVKWSDEVTTPERHEAYVIEDKTFTAIFEKEIYTVIYLTNGNGSIHGKTNQSVVYGQYAETVIAIPDEGYRFVRWSNGYPYSRLTYYPNDSIILTAIFEEQKFKVEYDQFTAGIVTLNDPPQDYTEDMLTENIIIVNGKVIWENVSYGKDALEVKAIPNQGYIFIKWDDGYASPVRQVTNVTEDIKLKPIFGFSAAYNVNRTDGGMIKGETYQMVERLNDFSPVSAIPNDGYIFLGWSDMQLQTTRNDISANSCIELVAYFDPLEKTFNYDYGNRYGKPTQTNVTLHYDKLNEIEFIVPEIAGYNFYGWYADSEFEIKVVNENGIYMLGHRGFDLDTDTLFARWEKAGEDNETIHNVLIVFTEEVNATLYSSVVDNEVLVDYKMNGIEREFYKNIPEKIKMYLNSWLAGITTFEVDSYYATDTLHTDDIKMSGDGSSRYYYYNAVDIPEVAGNGLLNKYHNILTIRNLGDYDMEQKLTTGVSGAAGEKYGFAVFERGFAYKHINNLNNLKRLKESSLEQMHVGLSIILHEFAHTCEMVPLYQDAPSRPRLHDVIKYNYDVGVPDWKSVKLFLQGEAQYNGETCGIALEYWKHQHDVIVNYSPLFGQNTFGKVVVVGEANPEITHVGRYLSYGSEITVKAIPNEGYRFMGWSDGIKTEERHDTNIISYLTVKAIFEKIN